MNFHPFAKLNSLCSSNNHLNEDGVPIRKIHVKGFRPTITQQELECLFNKFGVIEKTILKFVDGKPIYGFITFKDCKAAKTAMNSNVYHLKKKMVVSAADTWHQPRTVDTSSKDKTDVDDRKKDSETRDNTNEGGGGQEEPSSSTSSGMEEYTILEILNHDCMMNILSYLSLKELFSTQRVSKKWMALIDDKLQSLRVFKTSSWARESTPLTTNTFRTLLIKFGNGLKKLHLDYELTMLNQRTPQVISRFCPNITDLLISRINSRGWNCLLENCQQLKSLSLLSCENITDLHFQNINCKLETLAVTHTISLNGQFFQYLDSESLTSLTLNRCLNINGETLTRYFAKFKNLRKLSLDNSNTSICSMIDNIVELVPHLTEFSFCNIDIHYATQVHIRALEKLRDLEVLLLSKNCSVDNDVLKTISLSCTNLTMLDISSRRSFSSDVTSDGVNYLWRLPNLKVLGLGNLGISDTAFDKIGLYGGGSKLQTLVCRHNVEITNAGLSKVVTMSRDIRKIDAYGCLKVNEEFIKACRDALLTHPNRTEKLVLYVVHIGMQSEKCQEVLKNLDCPLIQVEIHEEFCDPLLHSFKLCCEYNVSYNDTDDDDDDDDFDNEDDFIDYDSDQFDFFHDLEGFDGDDIPELYVLGYLNGDFNIF